MLIYGVIRMKSSIIEEKLITCIKSNSAYPGLYGVPLTKLKNKIPVIAYDVDAIYKGNDIDLLCRVIDKCSIVNVNTFQMDHLEYFEDDDIHTLLYEKDEDGYEFPCYVETFYFDDTEKWLIYVSHEGTISFTGSKIVEIADKVFGNMKSDKKSGIFRLEHEVVTQCGISKERFRKVSGSQWENIYQKIAEKYADKTKIWKNGLHWANTNGYSPESMKNLLGCYAVDYSTWFHLLVKALDLLSHTAFLDNGWLDYYIVSKKYQWLIGFDHHDIISCIGEGLNLECFKNQ